MRVTIMTMTDSKYAHGCMTDWVAHRLGRQVDENFIASRDLIETAVSVTRRSREQNDEADAAVNQELDSMDSDGLLFAGRAISFLAFLRY